MKIALKNILKQLSDWQIDYKFIGQKHECAYEFASIKNTINYGFYYLEQDYIHLAKNISNSLIITNYEGDFDLSTNAYIKVHNPQVIHYKLAARFHNNFKSGIHPTAIISDKAIIGESVYIGPYCVIEDAIIGDGVQLHNHVIVKNNVEIKARTCVEANSVIGARGMSWIWGENGERILQPQLGGVIINEDCVIGTDVTIVRGSLNDNSILGKNCIIAHGTKIGHGCVLYDYVHTANNVSLAGNATIGKRTFLGSGSTISSNVVVGDNCIVGAGSVLSKSILENYVTIVGVPGKIIKTNNFKNKPKGAPKPYKK